MPNYDRLSKPLDTCRKALIKYATAYAKQQHKNKKNPKEKITMALNYSELLRKLFLSQH